MKKTIIALVLISLGCLSLAKAEPYQTTAKLPDNKIIWPSDISSMGKDCFKVTGKFIEAKPILTVCQGNWTEHTYLIRYATIQSNRTYPKKEVLFIATTRKATPESGIEFKSVQLLSIFREGTMEFVLKKEDAVRHMDYFNIVGYKQLSEPVN